jgi:hypothetical protein
MPISENVLSVYPRIILFVISSSVAVVGLSAQTTTPSRGEQDPESWDSIATSLPLSKDTVLLKEAEIRPFKDYASFKQAFITLELDQQRGDSVTENEDVIKKQLDMDITPDMDAQSNFNNNYVQNLIRPQGLIFLSTEPGKGLPVIPLIRKMFRIKKKVKSEE